MSSSETITFVDERELFFDLNNPRLVEYKKEIMDSQDNVTGILWTAMDAREIALSILANGFFKTEPMIVDNSSGRNIVIEGNRRLAAVRALKYYGTMEDGVVRSQVEKIIQQSGGVVPDLETLPVIFHTKEEAWRLLGFKHVNGPAKWGSYAKAQYIADVHNNYGISLDDIAFQIGDTHGTVQRLYKGIMILEQAESTGQYMRDNRFGSRLYFSHLYTGMQKPGVQKFLGLSNDDYENRSPVPDDKLENLGHYLTWLFGNREKDQAPIIQSQNPDLRNLDAILSNEEALFILKSEATAEGFKAAFESTKPVTERFSTLLVSIKDDLRKARGLVTEGFDLDRTVLRMADSIYDLAADLYGDMERMMNRQEKRKSRSTEDEL